MSEHLTPVRWNWNIRFGDVLVIVVIGISALVWGIRQEGRITANETRYQAIESRVDRNESRTNQDLVLIREQMTRIEDKLDRVIEYRRSPPGD